MGNSCTTKPNKHAHKKAKAANQPVVASPPLAIATAITTAVPTRNIQG